VFPFRQAGVDVLRTVSLFQVSSGCWLILLIAKGRHHSGEGLKDGGGLLYETSTFLF